MSEPVAGCVSQPPVGRRIDPSVGDRVPPFVRETGFAHWNRFAAVNDEFVPLHMDDAAAQSAGYPAAIGMGNLQWAYVHNALRDWIGDQGRIMQVTFDLRRPNLRGQCVSATGEVTSVVHGDGRTLVDLDVWTQSGDETVLGRGTAVVSLGWSVPPAP